jgi:hypothetical protein
MRYLLLGLALTAFSAQLFGQTSFQEKRSQPAPQLPYLLNPAPPAANSLTPPGAWLPFKNWQDLLKKGASGSEPRTIVLSAKASGWAASGYCSVPLLSIPLPEHFDDPMVLKMAPHYDDKMLLPTPPVCPLHDERAKPAKRE